MGMRNLVSYVAGQSKLGIQSCDPHYGPKNNDFHSNLILEEFTTFSKIVQSEIFFVVPLKLRRKAHIAAKVHHVPLQLKFSCLCSLDTSLIHFSEVIASILTSTEIETPQFPADDNIITAASPVTELVFQSSI